MRDDVVGAWGSKEAQLNALGLTEANAPAVLQRLGRTGGWRMRADIVTAMENARMSFSAAQAYVEAKNWNMVLLELADGAHALEEIKRALRGEKSPMADFWDKVDKL